MFVKLQSKIDMVDQLFLGEFMLFQSSDDIFFPLNNFVHVYKDTWFDEQYPQNQVTKKMLIAILHSTISSKDFNIR